LYRRMERLGISRPGLDARAPRDPLHHRRAPFARRAPRRRRDGRALRLPASGSCPGQTYAAGPHRDRGAWRRSPVDGRARAAEAAPRDAARRSEAP
jgi:hypothetical protein